MPVRVQVRAPRLYLLIAEVRIRQSFPADDEEPKKSPSFDGLESGFPTPVTFPGERCYLRFLVRPALALTFITVAVETPYLAARAGVFAPPLISVISDLRFASVSTTRLRVAFFVAVFLLVVRLPAVLRLINSSAVILMPLADNSLASFCASM